MRLPCALRRGIHAGVVACFALTLSVLTVWPGVPAALAQERAGDSSNAVAAGAVSSGVALERSRQWLEAIEHYESSLKKFPESKDLQYGLRRSKIHFAIERRYADSSFDRKLLPKSRSEALATFDEVLQQVRTNYVDTVTPTSFVAHGTESLYIALSNERFLSRNASSVSREQIGELRGILRDRFWNKQIASDAAAKSTVAEVCDIATSTAGLQPGAIVMEYVFGGCNSLDDYSSFLTPDRLDDLYGNIEGEFVGLGIEMKNEMGKGLLLVHVLPESPAEEGGLKKGDHIVMIEGADCRNMTTDEAARLLRGPSNSRVKLRVERPNDDRTWEGTFLRRAVQVKSIPVAKIVDPANGIGYIQMTGFQKNSAQELDEALARLQKQGMKSLIWDLRGNPGGLLTAAVEVLDRFVNEGVLVSTKGRSQDQNWTYSAHRSVKVNVPLVLLVDGDSASASEIVAGAVKDHHRGTIVGRQTFGKWSVQSIFPLREQTGLRLTTAKFYSPHGHTLGKIGVRPDVVIDLASADGRRKTSYRGGKETEDEDDADLQAGINVLKGRQASR